MLLAAPKRLQDDSDRLEENNIAVQYVPYTMYKSDYKYLAPFKLRPIHAGGVCGTSGRKPGPE